MLHLPSAAGNPIGIAARCDHVMANGDHLNAI
jgi:hypothetical protein